MRTILLASLLALAACTDVDSVTGNLPIVPVDFGQRYTCDMVVQLGYPTPVQEIHYKSTPCLASTDAEAAYEQAFVDGTCANVINSTPNIAKIGGGGCYGDCHTIDDGLDLCTLGN